jgi:hypothetical protein
MSREGDPESARGGKAVPGDHSEWRIALARELAPYYAGHEGIKMVVLGGSPSRGLADRYSDLDVIVYWDSLDRLWIEDGPLEGLMCERRAFMQSPQTDICLESWFFGTLKVDFGHVTMAAWEEMTGEVTEKLSTDGGLQKSIQGFLDSIVLYGHDMAEEWKRKLSVYPEGLARKMVEANLRLYVKGCLMNQGWKRGERLFFFDGLCTMFRRILGILAGVNRVYYTFDEPRWVEQELHRMPLAPADLWSRMKRALEAGGEEADMILEQLIGETVELVREHVPEADISRLERRESLRVDGCDRMPGVHPVSR